MGFRDIKKKVISCLENGKVQHELDRQELSARNLLATGEINIEKVIKIIKRANGKDHSESLHHQASNITVHILKTDFENQKWYIKFYFIEPNAFFISVHK